MKPSWLTVEYASTFLMSFCTQPIVAASNAVAAPVTAMIDSVPGAIANTGDRRQIRYKPDVTIVAAWISALTGVGPAIASGSHTYSGICALLPNAPTIRQNGIHCSACCWNGVTTWPGLPLASSPYQLNACSTKPACDG